MEFWEDGHRILMMMMMMMTMMMTTIDIGDFV